jgi:hypothetical protein
MLMIIRYIFVGWRAQVPIHETVCPIACPEFAE